MGEARMTDEQKEIFDKIKKELDASVQSNLFDKEKIKEQTIEMRKKVIEKNYGLDSSYKIICDETNNTLEDAENGVVNVDIIITHPKTIDKLPLNLQ
jgi:hypothetical protein